MKSTIEDKKSESNEIVYPCLMQAVDCKEKVVLFTEEKVGIQLTEIQEGIHLSRCWISAKDSNCWQPFTGKVILEND